MSSPTSIKKQLKIKTGTVTRLMKEYSYYQKEEEEQKKKLDKFVADGAEDWDIKNAKNMLQESEKMIKDSSDRLEKATLDLRDLVVASKSDLEVSGSEEFSKAEEALETTSA